VEKYPDNPVFANDLGYTLLLEGADPREAARLIQVALDAEPENPFYLDSMAWCHYLAGDYARAEELMAIPAQMEDMPAEIAWHLGAIYLKLGNLERAKEFLSLCVSIGGDQECVTEARHALRQLP
jgi:tetratricopeptide (TPR) repeat protein